MQLSNLSKTISIDKIYNFKKNKHFTSITSNSKIADKKTLFIYDKNSNAKKKYILEAIKNKTPAIISNTYFNFLDIPQFIVEDIKKETELLLENIYKQLPYKSIAVTGTNGKTSVVWYISKILHTLNYNYTSVGTLGHFKKSKKINDTNLTTPAYEELYKYGSSKKKKHIYIFELSSHALDQNRIRNYPIHIAAITNISSDHLDYHKTISKYKKAKLKLFTKYLNKDGIAIINSRIKNISNLKNKLVEQGNKVIFYGKKFIFFKKYKNNIQLNISNNKYIIKKLKIRNDIEFENLECAISCCLALDIDEKKIIKTLPMINNPPGRMQIINFWKKKSKIVIDYAHTPDALKNILKQYKIKNIKPVLLFGCGGERDKTKRKAMGIIANQYASRIYVTDDNPRNEDPSIIRKNIIKYCPRSIEIANRKKAIKKAIHDLLQNEILIIAGKGHEKIQIIKNRKLSFDDFKIVKGFIS